MSAIKPDAYINDPYGHVTNQCGHFVLGIAATCLCVFIGLWWPIPLAVAAVYWVISEYLIQRAGLFWDGIEDAGFVAAGAAWPFTVLGSWNNLGIVVGVGFALGIGAWRRA